MFDIAVRRRIDPWLDRAGGALARRGVSANGVTIASFVLGAAAAGTIAVGHPWLALVPLLLSRLGDGLDGAVARAAPKGGGTTGTDLGGYLDVVLDFGFYALVPLGFVLLDPAANAVAGATLLAAFYFNGASFLAYALMAEKRGLPEGATGSKAFLYTIGLMEGTETIVLFAAMCVLPELFAALAFAAAALTLVTTAARLALAWRTFR